MAKIKLRIDTGSIKGVATSINKLLDHNLKSVIKNQAIPFLIARIMDGYDSLSDRANTLPEDPTNPANWRAIFEIALRQDLENTFIVNGGMITVKLGDKEFLGYDPSGESNDPHDSTPLKWMVFYIEGLAGEWAYISPDVYQQIHQGATFNPEWGRFGDQGGGFMMSREQYESEGWANIIPFSEVRHPFSGYSPLDIFTEALREFRLRPFIDKALKASAKGVKL